MYDCLKLKNFRGFRDFHIELKPVTLISGKNNAGKTGLLESIFLFLDYAEPSVFLKLQGFRGVRLFELSSRNLWEPLFFNEDTSVPVCIELGARSRITFSKNNSPTVANTIVKGHDGFKQAPNTNYPLSCIFKSGSYAFEGEYIVDGQNLTLSPSDGTNSPTLGLKVRYIGPHVAMTEAEVAESIGVLELSRGKERLIEILGIIDKDISELTVIMSRGMPNIYVGKKDGTKRPLSIFGDGIRKLLHIAITILSSPNSVLLLDEIENGFHYTLFPKLWEAISTLSHSENCQVVATTHSYECIEGAVEGLNASGQQAEFTFARIDKIENGEIKAKQFTHEMLENALASNWEVR